MAEPDLPVLGADGEQHDRKYLDAGAEEDDMTKPSIIIQLPDAQANDRVDKGRARTNPGDLRRSFIRQEMGGIVCKEGLHPSRKVSRAWS